MWSRLAHAPLVALRPPLRPIHLLPSNTHPCGISKPLCLIYSSRPPSFVLPTISARFVSRFTKKVHKKFKEELKDEQFKKGNTPLKQKLLFEAKTVEQVRELVETEKEKEMNWNQEFWKLIAFCFLSCCIALYVGGRDETEYYVTSLSEKLALLYINDEAQQLELLENLAYYTRSNDQVKRNIASNEQYVELLLAFIKTQNSDCSKPEIAMKTRNRAVEALSNVSNLNEVETRQKLANPNNIKEFFELLNSSSSTLYVKKNLASFLSNLAEEETNLPLLLQNGLVSSFHSLMTNSSSEMKRSFYQKTLFSASNYLSSVITSEVSQRKSDTITPKDVETKRAIWEQLTEEEKLIMKESLQKSKNELLVLKSDLLSSGWILYLHTGLGGAAWGLIVSLIEKEKPKVILTNVAKTSLITSLIPIYFVGAMTTAYVTTKKKLDTTGQLMATNAVSLISLFPWIYIHKYVDKKFPYWIGGHVLGFMSFFAFLWWTDSDWLKRDADLENPPPRRRRRRRRKTAEGADSQGQAQSASPQDLTPSGPIDQNVSHSQAQTQHHPAAAIPSASDSSISTSPQPSLSEEKS